MKSFHFTFFNSKNEIMERLHKVNYTAIKLLWVLTGVYKDNVISLSVFVSDFHYLLFLTH